jgi:hypothetical protein
MKIYINHYIFQASVLFYFVVDLSVALINVSVFYVTDKVNSYQYTNMLLTRCIDTCFCLTRLKMNQAHLTIYQ